MSRHRPARRVVLSALLSVTILAVQPALAQAVVYVDTLGVHRGMLGEPGQMMAALGALDALPAGSQPTVVYVQSIDSNYTINNEYYSSDTSMYRERFEVIAKAAAEVGGPTPIFVATQWGTPETRIIDARNMGWAEVPIFPTTTEELIATGYDFLVDPEGIVLRWDLEAIIPQFAASRQTIFGTEFISPVEIILCANDERILGWARGRRDFEPTDASLGRFTRACLAGDIDEPQTMVMPEGILEANGLSGRYFAVLMPYAFREPVPVDAAVTQALAILGRANTEVPLLVIASDTVTADGAEYVTSEEHAAALAAKGVEADAELSAAIPDWVKGFVRHAATILVLFDDSGAPVGAYAASPSNLASQATLMQGLLRFGLF